LLRGERQPRSGNRAVAVDSASLLEALEKIDDARALADTLRGN